jgi:hypothetical protein
LFILHWQSINNILSFRRIKMPDRFKIAKIPWINWLIEVKIKDPISPIAYLIILDLKELAEAVKYKPDEKFYNFINEHMNTYLNERKMPPAPIAGAIMNLADDYMSDRPITIRAGDYIALQNFMRHGNV